MSTWWDKETEQLACWTSQHARELAEAGWFLSRTLDFGCGDMPLRDVVAGEYVPFDTRLVGASSILAPFDFIIATWVLQELADPALTLGYMNGWLEEGGRIFLTVPCAAPVFAGYAHIFGGDELLKLLSDAGFINVETDYYYSKEAPEVPLAIAAWAQARC